MYQNKTARHRHIAINNVASSTVASLIGPTGAGITTVAEAALAPNSGGGLAIALNTVQSKYVLVSYSLVVSGKFTARPVVFASTKMSPTVPTNYNAGEQSCPLMHTINAAGGDATGLEVITLEGEVLIPVLTPLDDNLQYVFIGLYGVNTVGTLQGQIRQYDSEDSFFQPSK